MPMDAKLHATVFYTRLYGALPRIMHTNPSLIAGANYFGTAQLVDTIASDTALTREELQILLCE